MLLYVLALLQVRAKHLQINLCEEYEGPLEIYQEFGIHHLRIPVIDYTAPTLVELEAAIDFMETFVNRGKRVFVHCKGGKGRSATVVLGYLMKRYAITRHDAQIQVMRKRPQIASYVFRRRALCELEQKQGKTEIKRGITG